MTAISIFFLNIFNDFKNWIIGVGAVILLFVGAFYKGKKEGREDAIAKDRKELQKDVNRKKQIKQTIDSRSNSDVDNELREWVKD